MSDPSCSADLPPPPPVTGSEGLPGVENRRGATTPTISPECQALPLRDGSSLLDIIEEEAAEAHTSTAATSAVARVAAATAPTTYWVAAVEDGAPSASQFQNNTYSLLSASRPSPSPPLVAAAAAAASPRAFGESSTMRFVFSGSCPTGPSFCVRLLHCPVAFAFYFTSSACRVVVRM